MNADRLEFDPKLAAKGWKPKTWQALREGQKVWLKADEEEGWERVQATFIRFHKAGTRAIVSVPDPILGEALAEITLDEIEPLKVREINA